MILGTTAASFPSHAQAQTTPADRVAANRGQIASWIAREAQTTTYPVPGIDTCTQVCDDLWLSEHRPMPNQPASQDLHRQLQREIARARWKAGVRVGLKTLGAVSAGVLAAQTGWWIGTQARSLFYGQDFAGVTPTGQAPMTLSSGAKWNPVYAGDLLVSTTTSAGVYIEVRAPQDGWYAPVTPQTWEEGPCSAAPPTFPRFVNPDGSDNRDANVMTATGFRRYLACPATGNVAAEHYTTIATVFQPNNPKPGVSSLPAGATAQNTAPGTSKAIATAPTKAQVEQAIEDELTDNADDYEVLGPWVDSNLPGSDTVNPLWPEIPNCRGGSYVECADALEDAGLVPVKTTLTPPRQADMELPADAVVQTIPPPGTKVEEGTEVEVEVNPETMPVVVPEPMPGETYQLYIDRLTDLGVVGQVETLSETTMDPLAGPNTVIRTDPQPGTQIAPGGTVVVTANPPTAPPAAGGVGGSCEPWVQPSINLDPLKVPIGMVFPFALPWWLYSVVEGWLGDPITPSWPFKFPFAEDPWVVDLAIFDPFMPEVRAVILVLALVAMAWLFVSLAYGSVSGGKTADD